MKYYISEKFQKMIHGGDYNPDQWIETPEIWDDDMRLMKQSGCNVMSVGIFSWSSLEPEEGRFEFGWLDTIMDKLADNGYYAVLATPSGSKPAWLSRAYPEVCRVNSDGSRQRHGVRHNHCRTSPIYREKCRIINHKLAERYKEHPALLVWHVSNEYNGGDCYCEHCIKAFQNWLKDRYDHDIDKLNHAYWSAFWSHTYPDWSYIEPLDHSIHGLMLDWERFKTAQTIDFFNDESSPLREITPEIPITTNFMLESSTLDYWAFSKAVDVVSWDSYPAWHETGDDIHEAARVGMHHDIGRSMKDGKPWMLMESVPSIPTRGRVKKRKEPGMHLLSSLQAVAHGSDTVQYFQWRKSRGGLEKFHGAVIDHVGTEHTRTFKEVSEVGAKLSMLDDVVGTTISSEVALIFDWENQWALNLGAKVYLGDNIKYKEECLSHYMTFWKNSVAVDVIDQNCSLEKYKLVIIPMAYMLRPGFAEKVSLFVENGGTAVMTYWSGIVDESDLCILGGVPGHGLREVFGVLEEESQSYFPGEQVVFNMSEENDLGISGSYRAVDTCSVIHAEGSEVLATFEGTYFSGAPALTVNSFGSGKAYYMASRNESAFMTDFYTKLISELSIKKSLDLELPDGVVATVRTDNENDYIFLMNFNDKAVSIELENRYIDLLSNSFIEGAVTLKKFDVLVLKSKA